MTCNKIQLLLSKYADNEATLIEREAVRAHIAGCEACARRLAEYETVSAIFSSAPTLPPEPQLRVGLFREIKLIKEDERRRATRARDNRPWYMPALRVGTFERSNVPTFLAAALAVFTLFGLVALGNRSTVPQKPTVSYNPPDQIINIPIVDVAEVTKDGGSAVIGNPEDGKLTPGVFSPTEYGSATMLPGGMAQDDAFMLLANATPVMEDLAAGGLAYVVRDPAYGYKISYPANWWTQTVDGVRYFRPWAAGGSEAAPYWIALRVDPNTEGYTASDYNRTQLAGAGALINDTRLRRASSNSEYAYDALYSFDARYIYTLQLTVPKGVSLSDFAARWGDAQAVFTSMGGRTRLAGEQPASPTNGAVLFLNGTHLFTVNMSGRSRAVTRGGSGMFVHQFALSPDSRYAAFTTAKERGDFRPSYLYVADLENDNLDPSSALWSSAVEIRDIVWYNDQTILALAKTFNGTGLYRITVPRNGAAFDLDTMVQQTTDLSGDGMAGAKGLAVSPDRQLITFLAPFGESKGSNIYAVRPDGSDLRLLVSHDAPVAPDASDGTRALTPEDQAIKSYAWVEGHLESNGYRYKLLFTCGNSSIPSFYKGGFLYSAPSDTHAPMLDMNLLSTLGVADPTKLQIVHVAYSTDGKAAMTGYYNDYEEGRADKLAGLWVAEIEGGQLVNIESQPIPASPNGIADLQWSPDNSSLVYRETMPQNPESLTSKYYPGTPFNMVKQDITSGERVILYNGDSR